MTANGYSSCTMRGVKPKKAAQPQKVGQDPAGQFQSNDVARMFGD